MSRAAKALLFSVVAITVILQSTPAVDAQEDGGLGGIDRPNYDRTVGTSAIELFSAYGNPTQGAERGHDSENAPVLAVSEGPPAWNSPRCTRGLPPLDLDTVYVPGVCFTVNVCGGERIDELASGEIAGEEASGRYAEFLDEMVGFFAADVAAESGLGDVASVNDYILEQGLNGDQPDQALPVFYWCGEQSVYVRENINLFTTSPNPALSPRFGWDTSIAAEYDLDALRTDALTELRALLGFYNPEINTVPPVETGVTIVNWPTWFWVTAPEAPPTVFSANSSNTFRLEMRAQFDRVDFSFDGQLINTCGIDDMEVYDPDWHDPLADAPECHHVFTQLATGNLSATIVFNVEQRIQWRESPTLGPYPTTPWIPVPGEGPIELTSTIADYHVCPIYVVNVAFDADVNELDPGCGRT